MSRTLIRPEWLFDAVTPLLASNRVVSIEDKQITAIEDWHHATIRDSDSVFEASGCTLLPGLIDLHVQLFSWGRHIGQQDSELATVLRGVENASRLLRMGVTTVRDVGAPHELAQQLANAIDLRTLDGPTVVPSGTSIGAYGRHAYLNAYIAVNGVAEARRAARSQIRSGARWINLQVTTGLAGGGGVFTGEPGWQELADDEIGGVVDECHRAGIRVMANAMGLGGCKAAIKAGVDCIDHGTYLDRASLARMSESHTALVPTISILRTFAERGGELGLNSMIIERADRALQIVPSLIAGAVSAGVPIGVGTDLHLSSDSIQSEILALESAGLGADRAIIAATREAAAILGLESTIGTIQVGKLADLVLIEGNPMVDLTALGNVRAVWKSGRLISDAHAVSKLKTRSKQVKGA